MAGMLEEISVLVKDFGSAPTLEEMPRRTLIDKGIAGPTAAHVIEEVHTPLNFSYLTFTTGSSAFQNIVGITHAEMPARLEASRKVLERAGVKQEDELVVTYPPLINVFGVEALRRYGVNWSFLVRSSRDAFLAALYEKQPQVVLGESSFIRAALEDAKHMGVVDELPQNLILLTAGTPLDLELLPVAEEVLKAEVHDLYGCQEFGWLVLDGEAVRDDIELLALERKDNKRDMFELVVGGLPMGDSFPITQSGHVCNHAGKIITYRRERTYPEFEVVIKASTLNSQVTLSRVARSILRIKGRIVKLAPDVQVNAEKTVLELRPDAVTASTEAKAYLIDNPRKTKFFDDLVQAQLDYQRNGKADPLWIKRN